MSIIQGNSKSAAGGFDTTLIGNSVWFASGDYLTQDTAEANSSRKEAIFSTWLQRTSFGAQSIILAVNGSNINDYLFLSFESDDTLLLYAYGSSVLATTQKFRDIGFYHILVTIDTSQNSNDSQKIFVNGNEITSFSTRNNFGSSADIAWGRNATHLISSSPTSVGSNTMLGYMAQTALITDKSFQQSDYSINDFVDAFTIGTNGSVFAPKRDSSISTIASAGGNNSFCFDFSSSSDLGNDTSGSNDFTATSMAAANQSTNTPSLNYPFMNPLSATDGADMTLSDGNLKVATTTNSRTLFATQGITAGAYYFEVEAVSYATDGGSALGIADGGFANDAYFTSVPMITSAIGMTTYDGTYYDEGGATDTNNFTGTNVVSNGDILQFAIDLDNGKFWLGKNNTWADGTTPAIDGSGATSLNWKTGSGPWFPFISRGGSYNGTYKFRFSSGDFSHTPPTGFLEINSENQPTPDAQGVDHFQPVLYAGNGSARSISTDIDPAWVWIKNRSTTDEHKFVDVVRGVTKELSSDDTPAEQTDSNGVTAFGTGSFSLGSGANGYNDSSENFVAWSWEAGTAFSNDASATSIGTLDSSGRVSATDALSVISYTGNATSGASIKHGLSAAPELVIHKERDNANGWIVGATIIGYDKMVRLDTADAEGADSAAWNNTAPTSSIITLGNGNGTNRSGGAMICYAFRSIPGVCKVGSYVGNGAADGSYVSLGFRPRWIMIKSTTTTRDWVIFDTARDTFNVSDTRLDASTTGAEFAAALDLDILSDGFKIRSTDIDGNSSGVKYLTLCWADIASGAGLCPIFGR